MPIVRVSKTANFTTVANAPFNDTQLTWEARGLLAHLLTKPDHWEVSVAALVNASPAGRDKVYRIIQELCDAGYMSKIQVRDQGANFAGYNYEVREEGSADPKPAAERVDKKAAKPRQARTKIPADYQASPDLLQWAKENGVRNFQALENVTIDFKLYHEGKGEPRANWDASWKTWVRQALNPDHWGHQPALTTQDYSQVEL